MLKVSEVIVVEGRYDKNTLSQIIDGTIIETQGFGIFSDKEKLALLRKLAQKRGLVVLTDSDGAGFVIRYYIKGAIDPKLVRHAYIPDVAGKERRKSARSKEGKLGVEGMTRETLVSALVRAGVVVNRTPDEATSLAAWERFKGAALRFLGTAPEFIGWVPADEAVSRSVQARVPVSLSEPQSRAARAFQLVSQWGPIDHARTTSAFYEKARRALR